MKVGRPTKYKKEYCKQFKEYLATGKNIDQCALKFGIAPSSVYLWKQQYRDFSEAIKEGIALSAAFWANIADRASIGMPITVDGQQCTPNPTLLIFTLKNKAGYKDKVDIESTSFTLDVTAMTPDERKARIAELLKETKGNLDDSAGD